MYGCLCTCAWVCVCVRMSVFLDSCVYVQGCMWCVCVCLCVWDDDYSVCGAQQLGWVNVMIWLSDMETAGRRLMGCRE